MVDFSQLPLMALQFFMYGVRFNFAICHFLNIDSSIVSRNDKRLAYIKKPPVGGFGF